MEYKIFICDRGVYNMGDDADDNEVVTMIVSESEMVDWVVNFAKQSDSLNVSGNVDVTWDSFIELNRRNFDNNLPYISQINENGIIKFLKR